jgi:UDP-2-acetamido-2-deoxy-ribo-hexuluronate aminotransferase
MIELVDLKAQYSEERERIDARIQAVLNHGQFIMGPEVIELEERLSDLTGVKHCVTVSSGSEALSIALMALGVSPGDEVVTSPFSFIAPAEAIVRLGAKPVFCDIEPDTCLLDAAKLEALITARTRAIVPVSLYGQPCDMDAIDAVASLHELPVIEDGAQSFGASYRGRRSCHLSTIGCTSFFPTKPLGCYGDGGALFTDDDDLARTARELRVHGQSARYRHTRVGVNGRMDTLQCAVVLAKLERFGWELERRRALAARYGELLVGMYEPVALRPDRESAFAQYTLLVAARDEVVERLRRAGIPSALHYPSTIVQQPAYQRFARDPLPVATAVAQRALSIPLHPYLADNAISAVVAALRGELRDPSR